MKKSVIYFRVSTSHQDEAPQLEDLKKWAKGNDFEVVKIFGEAKSGFNPNAERLELEKLKDFVIKNNIPNVLIWDLSRLGRSTLQTLQHIEFFTKNNINVIFKKDDIETLKGGFTNKLLINLLTTIAEMERNTIIARTKTGRDKSAFEGKAMNWSKMPLGYSKDENKFIIINDKEAPIIIDIFTKAAAGWTSNKIANYLNSIGVPTNSTKSGRKRINSRNGKEYEIRWGARTIDFIIQSTRYKGYREYTGNEIPVPRIVSDELWDEANKRLKENLGYLNRTKHDYLLKGKVVCGHCQYTMRIRRRERPKETGNRYVDVYYQCTSHTRTGDHNCQSGRFIQSKFDKFIYDNIILNLWKSQIRNKEAESEASQAKTQIEYWKKIIGEITKEIDQNIKLFRKSYIADEEFEKEMSLLNRKKNEADSEIQRLKVFLSEYNSPKQAAIEILKNMYWNSEFKTRRALIEDYLLKIVIYRVSKLDFDIKEHYQTYISDKSDGEHILILKGPNFQEPGKKAVLWYVEIFMKNKREPIKCLMSGSQKEINFISSELNYNKVSGEISIKAN